MLTFIQESSAFSVSRAPKTKGGGWSPSRTEKHMERLTLERSTGNPVHTKLLASDAPVNPLHNRRGGHISFTHLPYDI